MGTVLGVLLFIGSIDFYFAYRNPIKCIAAKNEFQAYLDGNFQEKYIFSLPIYRDDVGHTGKVVKQGEANPCFYIYKRDGEIYTNYYDYYWIVQIQSILHDYFQNIGITDVKIECDARNRWDAHYWEFRHNTQYCQANDIGIPDYAAVKDAVADYLSIRITFSEKFSEDEYARMYEYFLYIKENTPAAQLYFKYKGSRRLSINGTGYGIGNFIEFKSKLR